MISENIMNSQSSRCVGKVLWCIVLLASLAAITAAQTPPVPQRGFATPQLAVDALIKASEANDIPALLEIFGPGGSGMVSTGDPVQDKNNIAAFVAKAQVKKTVVVDPQKSSRALLSVGANDWPFPLPIVKRGGHWFFDSKAGLQEILQRRIGANELDAIQVCRGFVEAQWEYASSVEDTPGVKQFAQKLISSPGKRDGLYWANEDGTPGGPISEIIAKALAEGYSFSGPSGYHGYYYKLLKGQGGNAPLGELDYVIKGIMIGGFALIAVPAEYGVTGVKTFIVCHNGIVYEKDLGPDSLNIAKKMERFNPDKTWRRTDDEWPADIDR